jgi:hypothetical protein
MIIKIQKKIIFFQKRVYNPKLEIVASSKEVPKLSNSFTLKLKNQKDLKDFNEKLFLKIVLSNGILQGLQLAKKG